MKKSVVGIRDEDYWQELSKRIRRVEVLLNLFITAVFLLVLVPLVFHVYHADIHKTYDFDFVSLQHLRQEDTIQESTVEGNLMSGVDLNVANNSPPSGESLSALLNNSSEKEDVKEIKKNEIKSKSYKDNSEMMERQSESNRRSWYVEKERNNKPKKDNKKSSDLEIIPSLIIDGDEIDSNFHRILQANADTETTPCDKTLFRIEIRLDDYPNETSWDLVDETSGVVILAQNFTETEINNDIMITDDSFRLDFAEPRAVYDFEKCLEPGPYTFTIYDSFWDGINCGHPVGCFNIFLNDQLAVAGTHFNSDSEHSFDSSKTECFTGFKFMIHIDPVYFNTGIIWKLFNKNIFEESVLTQELATNGKITYVQCLQFGSYSFEIFEGDVSIESCGEEGPCYEVFIDGQNILTGEESFGHIYHEFFASKGGKAREQHCYKLPKLSPANHLNKFVFDESVSKALSEIASLSSMEMLQDIFSPQYRAACWLIYDDVYHLSGLSPFPVERYALAVFFFSTKQNIENLQLKTCSDEMNNIECNDQNHIMKLDYLRPQFPLKGSIPSEIGLLLDLESIDLGHNELQGSIPNQIARLTKLKVMHLGFNDLTGTIPWQIGELQRLQEIVLEGNNLHGSIPVGFGQCSRLQKLKLRTNKLNGALPSDLYDCVELKVLQVGDNTLNGTISLKIGNLSDLTWLSIEGNKFTGSLPKEVWSLSNLEEFNADFNQLTGSLPEDVHQLTALEWLDIDSNLFEGSIPNIFNEMPNLMYLDLSNNKFTGQFPDSIWNLQYEDFYMFENDLVGEVPSSFCDKVSGMLVDDSNWFALNPKVKCDCCDDSSCYVWDYRFSHEFEPIQCPNDNIITFDYEDSYRVTDNVANKNIVQGTSGSERIANMCLSPTGCYDFEVQLSENKGLITSTNFSAGYQIGAEKLSTFNDTDETDVCGAINMCGEVIDIEHPKRVGLNHLTQLAAPDLTKLDEEDSATYKALCDVVTKDKMYEEYQICDGTLLQRYVLLYFYYSQKLDFDFDKLATDHTCKWPGVSCDSNNKFIKSLDLPRKNLQGNIITEIGLLKTLEEIDLSNNAFRGTIDPAAYMNLPDLKVVRLGSNEFGGTFPSAMVELKDLVELDISGNLFVGALPEGVSYPKELKLFDISNNLFQGTFPISLLDSPNLEVIDLSRNNFEDNIPPDIGDLKKLRILRLGENGFVGSIPSQMFGATEIKELNLQSNQITGSIPPEITDLHSVERIYISHNTLKGTIPPGIRALESLEYLHLHRNLLQGIAPNLKKSETMRLDDSGYITDCGFPRYLLPNKLECEGCTMCCNSEKKCQLIDPPTLSQKNLFSVATLIPIGCLLLFIFSVKRENNPIFKLFVDDRDPLTIFNDDSVYCFIFSDNGIAIIIYGVTVIIQVLIFTLYLKASEFVDDSDYIYSYQCLGNSIECVQERTDKPFGPMLFVLITFLFLGRDFAISTMQIRKSVYLLDKQLLLSGFILFFITAYAFLVSFRYNTALLENSTDMITNTMILLFVNELDEKMLNVLVALAPEWTKNILDLVTENMKKKTPLQMTFSLPTRSNPQKDQDSSNTRNVASKMLHPSVAGVDSTKSINIHTDTTNYKEFNQNENNTTRKSNDWHDSEYEIDYPESNDTHSDSSSKFQHFDQICTDDFEFKDQNLADSIENNKADVDQATEKAENSRLNEIERTDYEHE